MTIIIFCILGNNNNTEMSTLPLLNKPPTRGASTGAALARPRPLGTQVSIIYLSVCLPTSIICYVPKTYKTSINWVSVIMLIICHAKLNTNTTSKGAWFFFFFFFCCCCCCFCFCFVFFCFVFCLILMSNYSISSHPQSVVIE